jgi:mannose-6-phosphate isomerase-like protein (cupin superfamily)
MKTFLHYIITTTFLLTVCHRADGQEAASLNKLVNDWSKSFAGKVPEGYIDTLCLHLKDDDSYRFVVFSNGEYKVAEGMISSPGLVVTADMATYRKVYTGDLSPLTAVGRASISDPAPLDFRLVNGMAMSSIDWEKMYFTLINFFNVDQNNKVRMGREYSRTVHGGNVVGLYYTVGYRSAYYSVIPGQVINEAGEKDPFHQSFIIIGGSGYAKLGNDTVRVKANEAYYIKPGMEHKVWTDNTEGLILIWSAWGTTW